MKRRSLLRATAAGTASLTVPGCLSTREPDGNGREHGESLIPPDEIEQPALEDRCDPVALPLSAMLGSERRDPDEHDSCFDGATTSLGIENERDESITVTVDVDFEEGTDLFEETYTLESNERVVERNEIPADRDLTVTIDVEGDEPVTGSWAGTSCYRHGISMLPDGVAIGYVAPFWGSGDTQYDCYPGDDSVLVIFNRPDDPDPETVHVRIHDTCTDDTFEETLDIEPDGFVEVTELLKDGGEFEVSVDVEGGGSATRVYEPHEICGGNMATIRDDGEVDLFHIIG